MNQNQLEKRARLATNFVMLKSSGLIKGAEGEADPGMLQGLLTRAKGLGSSALQAGQDFAGSDVGKATGIGAGVGALGGGLYGGLAKKEEGQSRLGAILRGALGGGAVGAAGGAGAHYGKDLINRVPQPTGEFQKDPRPKGERMTGTSPDGSPEQ